MRSLARLRRGLRRRGLRGLGIQAVSELVNYGFDLRYGVETRLGVDCGDLAGTVGDVEHAKPYRATQALHLHRLFRELDLGPGRVLVDLGSGKGRVLFIAALAGFRAARGVEFSSALCDVARSNVARFRARARTATEFEIIHADAGEYAIREDEDVFYLCNPFGEPVLRRVMASISASFTAKPRPMVLIYFNPRRAHCVTENSPFVRLPTRVIGGREFAIFEAKPSGRHPPRESAARGDRASRPVAQPRGRRSPARAPGGQSGASRG
jgi:SAM-dependent methyltransferase